MSSQINQLSQQTQKLARAELEAIEYSSIAELREKTLEILNKYTNASAEMASAYGANFFQSAMAENGEETSAAMYSFSNDDANEQAVRGMLQDVATGGSVSAFFDKVQNRLDYNIRKASNESVLENVKDRSKHLKFARVPTGRETCAFCFMLASRGFVYWSKATAGLYDHYHSNCDCRIVPGYDDMNPDDQIEGYEPTKLARQYEDCYNAVKSPDGGFDYDLFKKDVANGKYADTSKDWERWKLNRLMKEMKSRDTDWLWEKKVPEVTFQDDKLKAEITERRPHEKRTADRLSEHGVKCHFVRDVKNNHEKKGNNKGLADLDNGYELKTLSTATSYNTINDYLKGINKTKIKVKAVVFDNMENKNLDDAELIKMLKRSRSFHQGQIYVLTKDGGYYALR